MKIRNENMRKNLLDEIREKNPQASMMLQNSSYMEIQNFVKQYNESIGAVVPTSTPVQPN